jgi:Lrp/AsnC ligand binding domain
VSLAGTTSTVARQPNTRRRDAVAAGRSGREAWAVPPVGVARTDDATTGYEALVCIRTGPTTSPERFVAYLADEPTVVQLWRVAADIDVVVRINCPNLAALEAVVARMRHSGGAEHTVTHLVLSADTPVAREDSQ